MTLYSLMDMNSSYDFIWSNEHETAITGSFNSFNSNTIFWEIDLNITLMSSSYNAVFWFSLYAEIHN